MPSGLGQFSPTQPFTSPITFTSADTTVAKTLSGAINGPWRLFAILISSDDTAVVVVDIFLRIVATNYLLGSISVPAGTGHNGVAAVDWVTFNLPAAINGLDFSGVQQLYAGVETTMTAGKTCVVSMFAGAY